MMEQWSIVIMWPRLSPSLSLGTLVDTDAIKSRVLFGSFLSEYLLLPKIQYLSYSSISHRIYPQAEEVLEQGVQIGHSGHGRLRHARDSALHCHYKRLMFSDLLPRHAPPFGCWAHLATLENIQVTLTFTI